MKKIKKFVSLMKVWYFCRVFEWAGTLTDRSTGKRRRSILKTKPKIDKETQTETKKDKLWIHF